MEEKIYDNPLRRQCLSIPTLYAEQAQGVCRGFEESGLGECLKGITRVILTGCGDSYFASRAAVPAFQKYAGGFGAAFEARTCLDTARFLQYPQRDNGNILVVGVSASGRPARVCEALLRAKKYGCRTLALTNYGDSPAAQAAQFRFVVHTPDFPFASPGLRNYYASLFGLFVLAAQLGIARGTLAEGSVRDLLDAVGSLNQSYAQALPELDEKMLALAKSWNGMCAVETVGDGGAYPTAAFIAAKFVEASGIAAATTDAEDWCHVNFFLRQADKVGLIISADRDAPDAGRIRETLAQAAAGGRKVLLLSNGLEADEPDAGVTHVKLPAAPEGYRFAEAMYDFLPGALLASYDSVLRGETYFRGGRWSEPGVNTIQTSRIELV